METTTKEALPSAAQPVTQAVATGAPFRNALLETAVERAALGESELIHLSFDIFLAVQLVLASSRRIEQLRVAISKLDLDHELINRLELYAQAAGQAHALYRVATAPPEALQEVYEDVVEHRALLYSDASNLARAGLINRDALDQIENDAGFINAGYDVVSLVAVLRSAKERIAGRSVTSPEDWDRFELVANELIQLAAYREQHRQVDPNLAEDRLRAVSLMVKAYEQTRRAVQYLRFGFGDADKFAPSIYTAKGTARKREGSPETPDNGSLVLPDAGAESTTPGSNEEPTVPGGPGGNPFA